jgi:Zn-dependent peptidase ImmA (M78 family)/transcriptional regulator with XRE-family HTH domain
MDFNPQMLILARESRKMTQKMLCASSGVSQATISRSEAGVDRPTASTIEAWAAALRYEPALFHQRPGTPPLPKTYLFRKKAALKKADQGAITSTIEIRQMQVEALARAVDLPDPDVPVVYLGRDVKTPEDAARFLRAAWRIAPGPIPDLCSVVEDHGIAVTRVRGASEAFAGLSIYQQGSSVPPMMVVSADVAGERDRYTIAHELGHIIMHHHLAALPEKCEDEADAFAREFLMPAHEIRFQISPRASLADLAQLKLHWRCSMQALLMRGRTVGRISEAHEKRLWKLINVMGYKRQEPNSFPLEPTSMVAELVRVHVEELDFSVADVARALWLQEDEFRAVFMDGAETAPQAPAPPPRAQLRLV